MTYSYNSVTHKLDAVTAGGTVYNYSYDANGNITACPKLEGAGSISATLAIDYNVDNMPTQVVKSVSGQPDVTTNFYYDGNGARVRKEVVGESTTFYAGSLYEVKNGVATKYIFGADRRIAKITDGEGIQYFSKDHLGSSTVVTDDSGAVVEQADYRPFGEDRFYTGSVATPTPYKYTDQELDESTGLYNYDARHYDPAIGRFISPDSLIPNVYDPQQLNPYAYCSNNPLIYVDPTGHASVTISVHDPTPGKEGMISFGHRAGHVALTVSLDDGTVYTRGLYPSEEATTFSVLTGQPVDAAYRDDTELLNRNDEYGKHYTMEVPNEVAKEVYKNMLEKNRRVEEDDLSYDLNADEGENCVTATTSALDVDGIETPSGRENDGGIPNPDTFDRQLSEDDNWGAQEFGGEDEGNDYSGGLP
ncbi:RHS repeat-associated core domain-containing protein [Desulfatibacillum aliphaticivorans]|uniref:RHS repeat-associated core domain-containing protein n=1 Tax=Desulfatibacillum aliphaticivorans TaxID=218208 RepID=UPI00200A2668|nr:RHS repeat-associated core domain-containing protein [Desulfatibacillum aliphaticivorans]